MNVNMLIFVTCYSFYIFSTAAGIPLVFKMRHSDKNQVGVDSAAARTADVQIVTRQEWGARPPRDKSPLKTPVPFAVVHHTDGKRCDTMEECVQIVRGIQNFHMDERHWSDIGYNFLIGEDGRVYEGRGWDTLGAHAKSFNTESIGIAILGTYTTVAPKQPALDALRELLAMGTRLNKIHETYTLVGHRQTNHVGYTDCPGDALMCVIMEWPHWKPYQKIGTFVPPKC